MILLIAAALLTAQDLKLTSDAGVAHIEIQGRSVTAVHYGAKWDKPFLYPLRTPSGVILSRGWPVEQRAGDSKDHVWHRGLFLGHGDISGVDFWRELGDGKTGKIVVTQPPRKKGGRVILEAHLVTPAGQELGSVGQTFGISHNANSFLIDVRVTFRADAGTGLNFADTEEAMFGVRLREEFREDRGATLSNSEGLSGTKNIWGKRARWVDYSTVVDGKPVGLAIFDHPSNPAAPTHWHARGYGLNSANAFGVRDFTGDKSRNGAVNVPSGGELTFNYRVVLHDGGRDAADIAGLYAKFAKISKK